MNNIAKDYTWDGRPDKPEKDGYHWVGDGYAFMTALHWRNRSDNQWVLTNRYAEPSEMAALGWTHYHGPCYTPGEVAALERIAFQRGVEFANQPNSAAGE